MPYEQEYFGFSYRLNVEREFGVTLVLFLRGLGYKRDVQKQLPRAGTLLAISFFLFSNSVIPPQLNFLINLYNY